MTGIKCTNGTIADRSKKSYTCPPKADTKNCYPDSYTYCNKLSSAQKRNLIIGGIIGLVLALVVSALLSRIPLIGRLGALVINLALLLVVGGVVYIVYMNSRVTEKHSSYIHPSQVYQPACTSEFYSTEKHSSYIHPSQVYQPACTSEFYSTMMSDVYPLACDQ